MKFLIIGLIIILIYSLTIETKVQAYTFAMPEEEVKYTITSVDGILWAKIDGTYPLIYNGDETSIPMIYPTPPGTTNISVWLNDVTLEWSNLTETQSNAIHHTAIGDWSEILTVLQHISGNFVLRIHYEHPIQLINGSCVFLYDLNIKEYLSAEQNASVAHFIVTMETEFEKLNVFTVDPETEVLKPMAFSVTGEKPAEIKISEVSEFNASLPGDLLISFSEKEANNDNPFIISTLGVAVGLIAVSAVAFLFMRRRRNRQRQ